MRKRVAANGDCFFNAVSIQVSNSNGRELRQKTVELLMESQQHYICYLPYQDEEVNRIRKYKSKVEELKKDGILNRDIADIIPLTLSNLLHRPMVIYSSKLQRPTENVQPDMNIDHVRDAKIILSYLVIPGNEHYDACMKSCDASSNMQHSLSKTTSNNENSDLSNTNGSSMQTKSKIQNQI